MRLVQDASPGKKGLFTTLIVNMATGGPDLVQDGDNHFWVPSFTIMRCLRSRRQQPPKRSTIKGRNQSLLWDPNPWPILVQSCQMDDTCNALSTSAHFEA